MHSMSAHIRVMYATCWNGLYKAMCNQSHSVQHVLVMANIRAETGWDFMQHSSSCKGRWSCFGPYQLRHISALVKRRCRHNPCIWAQQQCYALQLLQYAGHKGALCIQTRRNKHEALKQGSSVSERLVTHARPHTC